MNRDDLFSCFEQEKNIIEQQMRIDIGSIESDTLRELLEYGIFNGGKRIRPILTVLAAKLCDHSGEIDASKPEISPQSLAIYKASMAFEYLHCGSLLHDDIIDHATTRRGKACTHLVWGDHSVILAGDFLHVRSMLLASQNVGESDIISRALGAMIEAEFLQQHNSTRDMIDESDYVAVIEGKTASLLQAACQWGGLLMKCSKLELESLAVYGQKIGIAFQIVDDILDYAGNENKTGKALGNDWKERKITLPLIETFKKANAEDKAWLEARLAESPEERFEHFGYVTELIKRYDGFVYSNEYACALIKEAKDALDFFPKSKWRTMLAMLADSIVTRET